MFRHNDPMTKQDIEDYIGVPLASDQEALDKLESPNFNGLSRYIAENKLLAGLMRGNSRPIDALAIYSAFADRPGTALEAAISPGASVGALAAPVVGAVVGGFGNSGVLRGGLRGAGAALGGVAGIKGGKHLANYLETLDSVKGLSPTAKGAITAGAMALPALLGSYLGYKGTKALSKSDKEKEEEESEKRASARLSHIEHLLHYIANR